MTKNERDKMIELLKRFTKEYCCEDIEDDLYYCNDCPLCNKDCCGMIMYLSEYLNDEMSMDEIMKSINREYNARRE